MTALLNRVYRVVAKALDGGDHGVSAIMMLAVGCCAAVLWLLLSRCQ